MKILLNVILFQLGWFACILGAAKGFIYLGPLVVVLGAAAQSIWDKDSKEILVFILATTILGSFYDSLGVVFGLFSFSPEMQSAWNYPLWMSALWLNFAMLFGRSLSWMNGKYLTAAILGLLGGPASYYAGESFGAIVISEPATMSLIGIGVMWAVVTPTILWFFEKCSANSDLVEAE